MSRTPFALLFPSSPPGSARAPRLLARRVGAFLTDLLALFALTLSTMVLFVAVFVAWKGDPAAVRTLVETEGFSHLARGVHILFYLSYFTLSHWYFGRTVGKALFGLRVTTRAGQELGLGISLARSFTYLVSGQLTLGAGFLLAFLRLDGRGLHDLLTNTQVIAAFAPSHSASEKQTNPRLVA